MTELKNIISPTILDLVVAFSDLTNFGRQSKKMKLDELFEFLSEYYELCGEIIEKSGGTIFKYMTGEQYASISLRRITDL